MYGSVAPHEGAWIEITLHCYRLKLLPVAPHEGAWIEILVIIQVLLLPNVAPHEGAWIEITTFKNHSVEW